MVFVWLVLSKKINKTLVKVEGEKRVGIIWGTSVRPKTVPLSLPIRATTWDADSLGKLLETLAAELGCDPLDCVANARIFRPAK
jgi:hypothetical protein